MIREKIKENIRVEDLTDDLKIVADVIGLEKTVDLMFNLSGMVLYIPRYGYKNVLKRMLQENGSVNIRDIAKELGVSENFIRNLTKD